MFMISADLKGKKVSLSKFAGKVTKKVIEGRRNDKEIHFYGNVPEDVFPSLDEMFEMFDVISHQTFPSDLVLYKARKEEISVVVQKKDWLSNKQAFSKYENVKVCYLTSDGYLRS